MGKGSFSRIGLLPNVRKSEIGSLVRDLMKWLKDKALAYQLLEEDAEALGLMESGVSRTEFASAVDLAVVLGGDGTMLRAAEVLGETSVPIFGVNIGKLGFLTAVEVHDLYEGLEAVLEGRHRLSRRRTIACEIISEGGAQRHRALNEFVVGKLARERMVHLRTFLNNVFFMLFSGDGIILSSASGSTAYSMSAGGPVVAPELDCFVLTMVCPHAIFAPPLVLGSDDLVEIQIEEGSETAEVSIDGRENILIEPGAWIKFFLDQAIVNVVQLTETSFYRTLRDKLFFPGDNLKRNEIR